MNHNGVGVGSLDDFFWGVKLEALVRYSEKSSQKKYVIKIHSPFHVPVHIEVSRFVERMLHRRWKLHRRREQVVREVVGEDSGEPVYVPLFHEFEPRVRKVEVGGRFTVAWRGHDGLFVRTEILRASRYLYVCDAPGKRNGTEEIEDVW
jgi:hypothetical protein